MRIYTYHNHHTEKNRRTKRKKPAARICAALVLCIPLLLTGCASPASLKEKEPLENVSALTVGSSLANGTGERLSGYARFRELLGRDFKRFFLVNLLTLTGFLPFFLGVLYALLSSSILVLIPACVTGGMLAGPFLSCTYDAVFRSLRDAPGGCMENFRRAWRQNWKASLLPGILFCLMLGFYAFMLMMFSLSSHGIGFGTIAVVLLGMVLFAMFFPFTGLWSSFLSSPSACASKTACSSASAFFGKYLGVHCFKSSTGV